MSKVKITVSVTQEVADYLRSTPNVSSTVGEAVEEYRARQLEDELADAYQADAKEAASLNEEWESADSDIED